MPSSSRLQDAGAVSLQDHKEADVIMLAQAPDRGKKRSLSPSLPVAPTNNVFLCPFPTCSRSSNRHGKGWQDAKPMIHHVANTHVANGEVPGQSWLRQHQRCMCGHCLALLRVGQQCKGENCFSVTPQEVPSRWMQAKSTTTLPTRLPSPPAAIQGTSLSEAWGEMHTLHAIMEANCTLLRHIPKGAVHAWGLVFSHILSSFASKLTWETLRCPGIPEGDLGSATSWWLST